jgi:broad specificity phosphatase PhoE
MKQLFKHMFVLFVGLLLMTGTAHAQDRPQQRQQMMIPDSARIATMVERYARELNLTDVQKETFTTLHEAHFDKLRAMRENNPERSPENRERMEAARMSLEAGLRKVLDKDQKKAFDKMLQERQTPREQRPRNQERRPQNQERRPQ